MEERCLLAYFPYLSHSVLLNYPGPSAQGWHCLSGLGISSITSVINWENVSTDLPTGQIWWRWFVGGWKVVCFWLFPLNFIFPFRSSLCHVNKTPGQMASLQQAQPSCFLNSTANLSCPFMLFSEIVLPCGLHNWHSHFNVWRGISSAKNSQFPFHVFHDLPILKIWNSILVYPA